jgi:anti-sigma-K factor RskA
VSPREDLHLDDELIALLALGERPGTPETNAATDRHLAVCGRCRSEVDELAAVARTARATEGDGPLVEPPPAVWESITRELGAEQPAATVVSLEATRARRRPWLQVAAAACVGAVVGGAVMYAATSAQRSTTPTTVVAAASLEPLAGSTARGSVQVVSTEAGAKVAVDVSGLARPDGFYEVWLLDKEGTKLIALGVLDGTDKGEFAMPPGVSMTDFPVVDVSLEPSDGDPNHSHQSLVRGTLQA